MDGARLMNAVVASGRSRRRRGRAGFDTAWVDFSKGLGAPVGACLAGSRELIDEAWRYKQMWGGAMRQAGIVAAGALYALDHHVERLADDHANARRAGRGAGGAAGRRRSTRPRSTTNIVVFEVADARGARAPRSRDAGVKMGALGPRDGARGHAPRRRRRRRGAAPSRGASAPPLAARLSGEFVGLSPTYPPVGAGASPRRPARR